MVSYNLNPIKINDKIIDISCGLSHNLILNQNGNAFSFGLNNFGQLGVSLNTRDTYIPQLFNINNIVQISTGDYHSLFLNDNNQLFSFGSKKYFK
jgi:alpha-tubulin suppressor-like RCC1 family protein